MLVLCLAREEEIDASAVVSNRFACEWPPKSGYRESFSEIDEARWVALPEASE